MRRSGGGAGGYNALSVESRRSYRRTWRTLADEKSMVFLAGPRQSGKTTLARMIAEEHANHLYFSWDIHPDRERLLRDPLFFTSLERTDPSPPLVVLDEFHKHPDWKNYLKGIHDRLAGQYRFLVTGSGRLDIHQRGGDSLAGRYLPFHFWPFTLAELAGEGREMADFLADPLCVSEEPPDARRGIWEGLEERKFYLWDAPRLESPGARFENLVALELMRAVTNWTDLGHGSFSLHFVKTRDGQEVDFLAADGTRPVLLVETKLAATEATPALRKFQDRLDVPAVLLTRDGDGFRLVPNGDRRILIAPAVRWIPTLP